MPSFHFNSASAYLVGDTVGAIRLDRDAALVTRVREGDRSAFDELVTRHRSYIYNLASRLCGDAEAAEDACVEAFCEAYRALPRFRPQAKFRTWLHRVAVNVCLEYLRETRARERHFPEAALLESVATGQDTCDLALGRLQVNEVKQAIEALPEAQRLAVSLFYLQDLSCAEIAQVLQIPRNTVKTRLFYGTRALRALLTEKTAAAVYVRGGSHDDV